jgi:hypothetical protein
MNQLQCGKDHSAGGRDKYYSIVNSIPPSFWIVKRREEFHEILFFNQEYKTYLPLSEMRDLEKKTDVNDTNLMRHCIEKPKSGLMI